MKELQNQVDQTSSKKVVSVDHKTSETQTEAYYDLEEKNYELSVEIENHKKGHLTKEEEIKELRETIALLR